MEAGVEAENRAAQHALQDLAAPGADAERFRVRPGDVPEGQDGGLGQLFSHHGRQQREVVVLHEHHGVIGQGLCHHRIGKALVDRLVGLPVRLAEDRPHVGHVAQRPQPFVGKAVVVALLLFGGEPDAAQPVIGVAGRHQHAVARVHHLAVGAAAAVGDPGARASPHHGLDGRDQPAGWALDHKAFGAALVDIRLAVGHDDHLVTAELGVQQRAQALGCPLGVRPLRAAEFVLHVAQAGTQLGSKRRQFGR